LTHPAAAAGAEVSDAVDRVWPAPPTEHNE